MITKQITSCMAGRDTFQLSCQLLITMVIRFITFAMATHVGFHWLY